MSFSWTFESISVNDQKLIDGLRDNLSGSAQDRSEIVGAFYEKYFGIPMQVIHTIEKPQSGTDVLLEIVSVRQQDLSGENPTTDSVWSYTCLVVPALQGSGSRRGFLQVIALQTASKQSLDELHPGVQAAAHSIHVVDSVAIPAVS